MIPLIIDTDVALGVHHEGRPRDIDDGFAMVEAINSEQIDLLAVTTVFGNAPLPDVHRVAREITALKGVDVPVARGAAAPMAGDGADEPNDAVVAMARLLRAQRAHIAAIGPLTNLGLLIQHYPGVLGNVESVIIVAGRSQGRPFFLGDRGPVRDFNFENDVRAATMLLESGLPLVLAGFELTSQVAVTERDLEAIAASGSATAGYFHANSLAWCRHWTREFPGDPGFHPWDSAAISWLKHPGYFSSEARGWRIVDGDEGTPWLETDASFESNRVTYLTGFRGDGARLFVKDVVSSVY